MALSGSFSNSVQDGHYKLKVDWTATQNVTNNTSTITAKIYLVNDWSLDIKSRTGNTLTIAGTSYEFSSAAISTKGTHLLATITSSPISHNSDGTKSVAMSCTWKMKATISHGGVSTYYGSITASATVALDTIARASQPSCGPYPPSHDPGVGRFGDTITIYMNRKSTNFTHTVRYQFGSQSGTIATKVGTSTTWTIPLSLMNLLPKTPVGSGTIYVDTYSGSTLIGTKSCGFTATVPDDIGPTFTVSVSDATSAYSTYGSYVKGLSKLKVVISATPAYGSPIKSYWTTVEGGTSYTSSSFTTGPITKSGECTVTVSVLDERGHEKIQYLKLNVIEYSTPYISKLTAVRCDADGTPNKRGGYAKAIFSVQVPKKSTHDTATYSLTYKKTTQSAYTVATSLSDLNNEYELIGYTTAPFVAAVGSSYDIKLTVSNGPVSVSKTEKISSGASVFSWRGFGAPGAKEDGAAIGKIAEKPNTLQIGWKTEFEEDVFFKGKSLLDFIYPVGSIVIRYDHLDPNTLFGGTWERIENRFLWATTDGGIIGNLGGESTHTLTESELPSHTHTLIRPQWYQGDGTTESTVYTTSTGSIYGSTASTTPSYRTVKGVKGIEATGGGKAHNNMPPYIQVSAWRRTA